MKKAPVLALVTANLVMVLVALLGSWGYYGVLLTLWVETVLIGLFNIGRITVVFMAGEPLGRHVGMASTGSRILYSMILNGFFIIKYGGFCGGLGLFLLVLPGIFASATGSDELVAVMDGIEAVGEGVLIVSAVLFVSHGISFSANYIGKREYEKDTVISLLFWPYARLVLIYLAVFSALILSCLVSGAGDSTLFSVILILIKLGADLIAHLFEHGRRRASA